jgi:hypothetical protein
LKEGGVISLNNIAFNRTDESFDSRFKRGNIIIATRDGDIISDKVIIRIFPIEFIIRGIDREGDILGGIRYFGADNFNRDDIIDIFIKGVIIRRGGREAANNIFNFADLDIRTTSKKEIILPEAGKRDIIINRNGV